MQRPKIRSECFLLLEPRIEERVLVSEDDTPALSGLEGELVKSGRERALRSTPKSSVPTCGERSKVLVSVKRRCGFVGSAREPGSMRQMGEIISRGS